MVFQTDPGGAGRSRSPSQPRIGRAVARALVAWPGSLPLSGLVVAFSWAPLFPIVAAFAGDLEAVADTLFAFGGLGTYSVLAGATLFTALGPRSLAPMWSLWLLLGFSAVLLQHLALGVLVHRLVTRATLAVSLRAGASAALRVVLFTLAATLALGLAQLAIVGATSGLAGDGSEAGAVLSLWAVLSVLAALPASRYVATLPVLVVEGRGCRDALRRSALLTRTARARVWLALVAFLLLPAAAVVGLLVRPADAAPPSIWPGLALGLLLATARAVWLAQLYRELRAAHDAPAASQIAQVFG